AGHAAGLAVPAVGEKAGGVAEGTKPTAADLRDPLALQGQPRQLIEIRQPAVGVRRADNEAGGIVWRPRHKGLHNLSPDFKMVWPDSRAQPGNDLVWIGKRGNRRLQHACAKPTPARMGDRHPGALAITEK